MIIAGIGECVTGWAKETGIVASDRYSAGKSAPVLMICQIEVGPVKNVPLLAIPAYFGKTAREAIRPTRWTTEKVKQRRPEARCRR